MAQLKEGSTVGGKPIVDEIKFNSQINQITQEIDDKLTVLSDDVVKNKAEVTQHLAQSLYKVATGTATAILINGLELTDGNNATFIASGNNNGAVTTINGKPLYKPNSTTVPKLVAGKAYTVWYNSTSQAFFIKASAEGTAQASHVLANQTFSNDDDTNIIGTMPNRGSVNLVPSVLSNVTIAAGYYSGGHITKVQYSAGETIVYSENVSKEVLSTTPVKVKEFRISHKGNYRIKFSIRHGTHSSSSFNMIAYARIYKNGSPVGTQRSLESTTDTLFTEDIAFDENDLIQIYAWTPYNYMYTQRFEVGLNTGVVISKLL